MSRVVQLTNARSGPCDVGTVLDRLAAGYAAAGHDVVRIGPGQRHAVRRHAWGCSVELPARELPGTGVRVLTDLGRVQRELAGWAPDRVEVHDRTTLRAVGGWARAQGVPSLVVLHDRLDRWLRLRLSARLPLDRLADHANAALAEAFDGVVCTSRWGAREFARLGVPCQEVPLGVHLPSAAPAPDDDRVLRLVLAGPVGRHDRPDLAVGATRELCRRGHRVALEVAAPRADGANRAAVLGRADVALVPGPVSTVLAALDALACGTPVVANVHSAVPEVLGEAGTASAGTPRSFADAVERLLEVPAATRRARARAQAEAHPWSRTVEGFLRAHQLHLEGQRAAAAA